MTARLAAVEVLLERLGEDPAPATRARLEQRARDLGPHVHAFVAALMARQNNPEYGFRSCYGVLRLASNHPPDRFDNACRYALVVEDFEEIAAAHGFDGGQAPVVEDHEVDAGEFAVQLGDNALAMGDAEIVEQPRHAQVERLEPFEAGLVGERADDPALAGAGRAASADAR
ncbi:MAG: hypothetical protein OYH76_24855 [Defluviicoccus sp.]|nr:hypothetical protein [Defluviicoccus sp.]MDE0279138.1 hypothetical protein [Defluviicoccus sp.]